MQIRDIYYRKSNVGILFYEKYPDDMSLPTVSFLIFFNKKSDIKKNLSAVIYKYIFIFFTKNLSIGQEVSGATLWQLLGFLKTTFEIYLYKTNASP